MPSLAVVLDLGVHVEAIPGDVTSGGHFRFVTADDWREVRRLMSGWWVVDV